MGSEMCIRDSWYEADGFNRIDAIVDFKRIFVHDVNHLLAGDNIVRDSGFYTGRTYVPPTRKNNISSLHGNEPPVIRSTNSFMLEHFGEPARFALNPRIVEDWRTDLRKIK